MSVLTDQDLHTEIQYALVETPNDGASYVSGQWSVVEVSDALTAAQNRLLRTTGLIITRTSLSLVPNTFRAELPTDWMASRRLTWRTADSTRIPLYLMSWAEADYGSFLWEIARDPHPLGYLEPISLAPPLELYFVPAASDTGIPEIWYLALGTTLSNTGVVLTVPDELAATVKYAALADLLAKEGRGYDPERAAWCEARATEGLALAQAGLLEEVR